jgi:uracil-DNA glycosylase
VTGVTESGNPQADLAALAWLVELGADEAIGEAPVDRFAAEEAPRPRAARPAAPPPASPRDAAAPERVAAEIAAGCRDLEELRAALDAFEGSALKRGARNLVFADGVAGARVMIVGEAPGREEDATGKPFVGRSGQLLDRMLAAIGLDRGAKEPGAAVYITNVLPWRPPANRDPAADEIAMLVPFLHRHIELARPEVLVLMGAPAARVVLETTEGITRLRGRWTEWRGVAVLPMVHPASLLRDPSRKRAAWSDLLSLRAWLDGEKP